MSSVPANRSEQLIATVPAMSDDEFRDLATSSKFLPRVQLFGSSSKMVKQGKFPMGHYGLVTGQEKVEDIGTEFDSLPIQVRAKAMDVNGDNPVSIFNKDSDEFKDIKNRSTQTNSGCMWGPEFLLWLPAQERFATMFFCNPTMRRESPNMKDLLGMAVTCRIHFIESKAFGGWHGPQIVPCSTPFPIPSTEDVDEQLTLFLNPPQREIEKADAAMERAR